MGDMQDVAHTAGGRQFGLWTSAARGVLQVAAMLFSVTAVYQCGLALHIVKWGHRGHPPAGHRILLVAFVAMGAVGMGLVVVWLATMILDSGEDPASGDALAASVAGGLLLPLVVLGAAAGVVAGFYAPDPYYLNTGKSVADGGTVSGTQIAVVIGLAAVAAVAARFTRRHGLLLAALAVGFAAMTLVAEGTNH
jgi:hypothetical protein